MTNFLCTKCASPAWFYLDGGMLCPDHAAQHVMAGVKDMIEQTRVSPNIPGECAAAFTLATSVGEAAATNSDPSVSLMADGKSAVPLLAPGPGAAGALQNPFLASSTTTLRMAASSLIHESSDMPSPSGVRL